MFPKKGVDNRHIPTLSGPGKGRTIIVVPCLNLGISIVEKQLDNRHVPKLSGLGKGCTAIVIPCLNLNLFVPTLGVVGQGKGRPALFVLYVGICARN